MLVVTAIRCMARFYQDYTVDKVVNTTLTHIREDMFEHSLHIPVGYFAREGQSNTVSKMVRDTGEIGGGVKILFGKTLREPFKALSLVGMAMLIERNLTLVFLGMAPVSLFVLNKLGKKIRRATKKSLESWAIMLGKLHSSIFFIKFF